MNTILMNKIRHQFAKKLDSLMYVHPNVTYFAFLIGMPVCVLITLFVSVSCFVIPIVWLLEAF